MNAPRDPDRMIHHFLLEGGEELHDQVYDAVRADIEHRRQRAVIGPWRMPDIMSKYVPLGLGAAAVAAVLVIGTQLLSPSPTSGPGAGPFVSPSPPTVSPSPTPSASVAAPSASAEAGLPVGSSHLLIDGNGVRGTVTIPAPGWFGDGGILTREDVDPPAGAGMITFVGELYVYEDPCTWSTTVPETPAGTVGELVAALADQADRDATPAVDVTVGGYAGKSITLHVPDDIQFTVCDQGYFGSWGGPAELTPYRYHQGPGQIDEVWILDVDGVLTVIDAAYYEGTPTEHVAQMRAIVESMTFE